MPVTPAAPSGSILRQPTSPDYEFLKSRFIRAFLRSGYLAGSFGPTESLYCGKTTFLLLVNTGRSKQVIAFPKRPALRHRDSAVTGMKERTNWSLIVLYIIAGIVVFAVVALFTIRGFLR